MNERGRGRGKAWLRVFDALTPFASGQEECEQMADVVMKIRINRPKVKPAIDRETLDKLLGMNSAWPLADTLDQLVNAARHLLTDHDCDQHGHELVRGASLRGAEYADKIRILLAAISQTRGT